MSMTNPTYGAVSAILKTKYPDGTLPQALYKDFPFAAMIAKKTDFDGEDYVVALQNERPQGSSSKFTIAQGVSKGGLRGGGGSYKRFRIYRTRHYGILRMDGETMKAAVRNSGALVDLWNNETDGISKNELAELEFQLNSDGTGRRATVGASTVAYPLSGGWVNLATPADAVFFYLGMRIQFAKIVVGLTAAFTLIDSGAASDSTGQGLYVSQIDRRYGRVLVTDASGNVVDLTAVGAGSQQVTAAVAADQWVVRAGDGARPARWNNAGTFIDTSGAAFPVVGLASNGLADGPIVGAEGWIPSVVMDTDSATFWGLNRTQDPVRLAGQRLDATGLPMNEALMEAEGLVAIQGVGHPDTIFINPLDLQNLKKALGVDIRYDRVASAVAGVSFKAIEYDGMYGPMKIIANPYQRRNSVKMLEMASWQLKTLGPAPQMLDWDNNDFLRVYDGDQYESRFGHYGQAFCNNPGANIIIDNFGL